MIFHGRFWLNFLLFMALVMLFLAGCSSTEHLAEAPLCRGGAFPINQQITAQSTTSHTGAVP